MRILFFLFILLFSLQASEYIIKEVSREENSTTQWIALPYIFSSDTTGLTGGVVGIFHGFFQPQITIVASLFVGERLPVQAVQNGTLKQENAGTQGGFIAITGVRVPYTERFFVSYMGLRSYYPNQRLYLNASNDSEKDLTLSNTNISPLQTQGWNNWANIDLRYVMPLGESKKEALPVIETMRGLPINRVGIGGGAPFVTGQTVLGFKPFYQRWTADKFRPDAEISSNGLKFYLEHDNTDYPDNPSRGYHFKVQYAHDFGAHDSTQAWNSIDLSYSQFINLGNVSFMRQNVLALNLWSAYSPSWDKGNPYIASNGTTSTVYDKGEPPMWEGARLGGMDRMRAYDTNRFNDKAAIYGAIEYRAIPQFNPMKDQKWSPVPIMWWQTVLYAEVGRVAPEYNLDLFKELKYDVGFSIRALAATVPVRFEMAFGSEGSTMWVMLKQPF